jgi:prepilin-type N-terminal cleavage/methylation domain-containing protein
MSKGKGFSLIELLLVLAIMSILAIASVSALGNRPASAVHSVMDEIEGVLSAAHKQTTATQGDITLTTDGIWGSTVTPATLTFTGALAPSDSFRYVDRSREYGYAGIACGTNWEAGAIASLKTVPPADAGALKDVFQDALSNPLFTGGVHTSVINGYSKRFSQGFYVAVVGLRSGAPVTSGPVGVLVVPRDGNSIYKFYRGNAAESWRRL